MITEPKTDPALSTLLEAWVARTRLSWSQTAAAVSLGLLLLLVGAAYLDGVLTGPIDTSSWRNLLMAPAIVAYVLLVLPKLKQLRENAIAAFRPLVPLDDERFQRTLAGASVFNRRRELLALGAGAVAGVLLNRAWWPLIPFWMTVYFILASAIMYGLLGCFVYSSLSGTRLFRETNACALDVSVFELALLEPVGRWSLGVALSYVGGNTLSLIFIHQLALIVETAIIYGVLLLAPVLVFFLNMASTRRIMVNAKKQELKMVRESLVAASQALKEKAAQGEPEDMRVLLDRFTSWVAVEKRVREVPEWPYTTGIQRSMALSLLLPIAVGVSQALLTQAALRLLH